MEIDNHFKRSEIKKTKINYANTCTCITVSIRDAGGKEVVTPDLGSFHDGR